MTRRFVVSTELRAYRGNKTHNDGGTHLGYRDESNRLVILCGQTTANVLGCRCLPWWPTDTKELTCRGCYLIGKGMHNADLRIRLVLDPD